MQQYKGLIVAKVTGKGTCSFCGKPNAKFVDISFECHICNLHCADGLWKEYLAAERKADSHTFE
jgi:ribosomal protein L37AE/L43A